MDSQVGGLSYIFLYAALPIEIILVTSVAFLPRSTLARLILFGTLTALTLNAFRYATGIPATDYALGSALVTQLFVSLNLICLTNPLDEYRHKRDVITPREMGFERRMWWAFCAVHSLRGVGWNYRVPYIPTHPTTRSRTAFILSRLLRCIVCLLLLDLVATYTHFNPRYLHGPDTPTTPTQRAFVLRALDIVAMALGMAAFLNLPYALVGMVGVAVGLSEPGDWPEVFGGLEDAWSVRRFWGRTWHQNMYRFLSAIGNWTATHLGFQPGTRAFSFTRLYIGFLISGLIHTGGDIIISPSNVAQTGPFFFYQALAITFEEGVMTVFQNTRLPKRAGRLMGYLWVVSWFLWTAPSFLDGMARMDANGEFIPEGLSPCRRVLGVWRGLGAA